MLSKEKEEILTDIICKNLGSFFKEIEVLYESTVDKILEEVKAEI